MSPTAIRSSVTIVNAIGSVRVLPTFLFGVTPMFVSRTHQR